MVHPAQAEFQPFVRCSRVACFYQDDSGSKPIGAPTDAIIEGEAFGL